MQIKRGDDTLVENAFEQHMKKTGKNSPSTTIKAISFDLDDTLWDNRPVLYAAEQTLFDWLVEHYPRIGELHDVLSFRQMRLDLAAEREELRHHMTRLRKVSLQLLAEAAGYDDSLVEPAFEVFIEARHRITLYDDVTPGLQALRNQGFLLGALTNGNADIGRLDMAHLFDFSLTAESAGSAKPDPQMFLQACRQLNIEPSELAHVGDEHATDIVGACNAGATAVWMNRLVCDIPNDPQHHYEVKDMAELLVLAQSWR